MNTYTPDPTRVVHYTSVDLSKRHISDPIHVVQYDDKLPIIAVSIYNDGDLYIIPEDAVINIRYGKPDYTFVYNPALGISSDKTKVYFEVTYQMTVIPGEYQPVIEVQSGLHTGGTSSIPVNVDKNPITNGMIESTIEFKLLIDYVNEAREYADGAKESEINAKTSETNSKDSEVKAKESETKAKESELAATTSEDNAKVSETKAKESEDKSKISETNAATSEANAKVSEDNAKVSETNAKTSEDNTKEYYDDTVTFWNDATTEVNANEAIRQQNEEERKASEILREEKYVEMVDATAESILSTSESKTATQESVALTTTIQEKLDNGEFQGESGVWVGADNPPNEEYVVWVDPEAIEGEFATVAITGSYNDLKDKPTSLPADGGNANTIGGKGPDDFATAEHTHTKDEVGLDLVDNTADVDKHVAYAEEAGNASTLGNKDSVNFYSLTDNPVLANDTDLNDIKQIGQYRVSTYVDAETISNKPEETAFTLIVENPVGDASAAYLRQIFKPFNNNMKYERFYQSSNNTWSSWTSETHIEIITDKSTIASLAPRVPIGSFKKFLYAVDSQQDGLPSDYPLFMLDKGYTFYPMVTINRITIGLFYIEITSPNQLTGLTKTASGYYNGTYYWNEQLDSTNIANNLVTNYTGLVLDASQGKVLNDKVAAVSNRVNDMFLGNVLVVNPENAGAGEGGQILLKGADGRLDFVIDTFNNFIRIYCADFNYTFGGDGIYLNDVKIT